MGAPLHPSSQEDEDGEEEVRGYYLRVSGTNFGAFLADTQDLSTIRGGSLLLREAIDEVSQLDGGLEAVTTGASEGLFRFEAASDGEAERRRRDVVDGLRRRLPGLCHATLAVDVTPDSGDFGRDKETCLALNRWRQMQSPSVAVPSPAGDDALPCTVDGLRPASPEKTRRGERVSASVYARRRHGLRRKQDFYHREAGLEVTEEFSRDLERLASHAGRGSLDGKMAVLYIDGNAFGEIQRRHVKTRQDQRAFDHHLQTTRRAVLRHLVEEARGLAALREEGGTGAIRLETLLWGGDEVAWVVPGWAAAWAVGCFFGRARDFAFSGETLYHAAGLVLCHHNAPIHRMRALAEGLADLAKAEDRQRNLLAYEVLESFDDVGDDVDAYRRSRCPAGVEPASLLLAPEALGEAVAAYGALRRSLPWRQVRMAVDALFRGHEARYHKAKERVRGALVEAGAGAPYDALLGALGGPRRGRRDRGSDAATRVALLHLATLGEYLLPVVEDPHA